MPHPAEARVWFVPKETHQRVLWVACRADSLALANHLFRDLPPTEFQPEAVTHYQSGLTELLKGDISLCLVDNDLGAQSGIDFIRAARAGGALVPILLLTSSVNETLEQCALEAGADDLLVTTELSSASLGRVLRFAAGRMQNARRMGDREAQRAIRLRDDFLAIAAHELKTPLTPLQLQLDSLVRALSPEEQPALRRRALQAQRQLRRMIKLVETLVSVSRITHGKLTLDVEAFDLSELLVEVVGRFTDDARRSDSSLTIVATPPAEGFWDRLRLEQMCSYLILNAIKYGQGKPIEVSLLVDREVARISVCDHGIGIAPEDTDRIFRRFEHGGTERVYGGLGLGLYLARQIAQAHGGSIVVHSAPDQGSRFTVVLPRDTRMCHTESPRPIERGNAAVQ